VYFATHKLATQSGVMVTGSHNPPDQNGFKIVIAGTTLSAQAIQGLKQRILEQDFSQGQGQIQHKDITDLYRDTVCDKVNLNRQKPLKVAIDCGNGVAGLIVPDLLNQLGVEVLPLFTEVDGHFPNHHPDPSQPKNLAQLIELVKTQQADVGLAFDGDGDRLGVVTETGKIIYPDQLVSLFAQAVLKQHQGAKVIYDVKCSRHLADIIKAAGGEPMMWKTGHSLIKAKLKQSGALLAGEMSGHIFFQERWYGFDDAAYSAVRLLEILSHTKLSLGQLMASFPQDVATPELSIDTEDEAKFHIIEGIIANEQQESSACFKGAQLNAIDGLRVDFTKGWGLIRASNTTAKLVLRFEAADEATLKAIQQKFKQAIQQVDAALDLPF
jgi:phosphomannomutase/phosphoglucomutase